MNKEGIRPKHFKSYIFLIYIYIYIYIYVNPIWMNEWNRYNDHDEMGRVFEIIIFVKIKYDCFVC